MKPASNEEKGASSVTFHAPALSAVAFALALHAYGADGPPPARDPGRAGDRAPRVGQAAPEIDLPRLGGDGRFRMGHRTGNRPTVVIFGSYT